MKKVLLFFIHWSISIGNIVDGLFSLLTLGLITGKFHPSAGLKQAIFCSRMRCKWGLSRHQKEDYTK